MLPELRLIQTGLMLLVLAFVVLAGSYWLTDKIGTSLNRQHAELVREQDRLARQIALWEENAKTAKALRGQISETEIDSLLAPMPVSSLIPTIEAMAALSRLTHLKLSLSDGKPWDGGTAYTGIEGISRYAVSLDAQAPLDSDIYNFLGSLPNLSGHLDFTEITVTRLPQAPPSALNVSLKLRGFWYGNRDREEAQ